jgi:hypothetical protein
MAAPVRQQGVDLSAAPRVVVGAAADLIDLLGRSMLGPKWMPTAQANAWAAVCADRERARMRAQVMQVTSRR